MDLIDQLEALSAKIERLESEIKTEEATKTAFVMPFFKSLGYDTSNPLEFVPEFTADVGSKKHEKVDYAINVKGEPKILIEAKCCNQSLDKHDEQLLRYFSVTNAKIGILTNGIVYKFYTDLEEENKMDRKPFLKIDLLNLKDENIDELKKFLKSNFDIDNILSTAETLKYSNAIKELIINQFENPDDEFVNYILGEVYEGIRTQNVRDKFKGIIKKSASKVLNDMVRSRLENALESGEENDDVQEETVEEVQEDQTKKIKTTEEELSGFYIVKSIYAEFTDPQRITHKDTLSYFGILLEDNTRKWLCRLHFNHEQNYIEFPVYDNNGHRESKEKFKIDNLDDMYQYKTKFKNVLSKLDN